MSPTSVFQEVVHPGLGFAAPEARLAKAAAALPAATQAEAAAARPCVCNRGVPEISWGGLI